jgi:hypothetical protein
VKGELVMPAASGLFPGFPEDGFAISRNFSCEKRSEALVGREGLRQGKYDSKEVSFAYRRCLSQQGLVIERELEPFEKPKEFEPDADGYIVQNADLTLTPNGELVPGCCTFQSAYAVIADMRHDGPDEIQRKTTDFVRRLDKLRSEDKLDCIECISSADKVRRPKLLRKAYGNAIAKRCLGRRSK